MKSRFKGYAAVVVTVLIVAVCASVFAAGARGEEMTRYEVYRVQAGDTLWDIADRYVSENYDIRKYIYDIMKENNLDSAALVPGQVLHIPLEGN